MLLRETKLLSPVGLAGATPGTVAISAHKGGAENGPSGTLEAYAHAVGTGAEYIEFDIRATGDKELVVFHDAHTRQGDALADTSYARLCELAGFEVPRVADVMRLIAGKAIGHLDLKVIGGEDEVVGMALDILGPGNFVATTLEDESVAAIKARFPDVPTALSLGRGLGSVPPSKWAQIRLSELFPMRRIRACRADWASVNRQLAAAGVVAQCHRHGITTMVWTVDDDKDITRWLADPRVAVLITDRPAHAVALRERLAGSPNAERAAPLGHKRRKVQGCRPFQDQCGMVMPSGTSAAESW